MGLKSMKTENLSIVWRKNSTKFLEQVSLLVQINFANKGVDLGNVTNFSTLTPI